MPLFHPWPSREPAIDERIVGITFVDVLFALVIGEILTPLRSLEDVSGPGRAHLAVAAVLTLASWIGYHNSQNRPIHFIRFPNLPLFQFLLDVAMVVTYWSAAVTAEAITRTQTGAAFDVPSARPEAIAVATAFVLYVAWDGIAFLIRKDDRYRQRPRSRDVPARRGVTAACAALTTFTAVLVSWKNPHGSGVVYFVDVMLIVIVVGFRLLKEYMTVDDPFATRPPVAGQPSPPR